MKPFALILLFIFVLHKVYARDFIHIEHSELSIKERKAILILPGLGGTNKRKKKLLNSFKNQGYDVFIPDYRSRKSVKNSSKNLLRFCEKHQLSNYKNVCVFSFIFGAWALNDLLDEPTLFPNISHIVYDRGPIQEKIGKQIMHKWIFFLYLGRVLPDFANTSYPPNHRQDMKKGILIETGTSKLAHRLKEKINRTSYISFHVDSLHQANDDFYYIPKNHDEMYEQITDYKDEVLFFFRNGQFNRKNPPPIKLENIKIE